MKLQWIDVSSNILEFIIDKNETSSFSYSTCVYNYIDMGMRANLFILDICHGDSLNKTLILSFVTDFFSCQTPKVYTFIAISYKICVINCMFSWELHIMVKKA